jgi:hypothetical protein
MSIVSLKHILKHQVEEESKLPQATTLGQYSFPVCGKSVRVVSIRNQLELIDGTKTASHSRITRSQSRTKDTGFLCCNRPSLHDPACQPLDLLNKKSLVFPFSHRPGWTTGTQPNLTKFLFSQLKGVEWWIFRTTTTAGDIVRAAQRLYP